MNAKLPPQVAVTPWHEALTRAGLARVHQGKVRDTYALLDEEQLLVVATDRLSIFDHVLPRQVPCKGELLTALTVYWLDEVMPDIDHHLIAYGQMIAAYLPSAAENLLLDLGRRAIVVRKCTMLPVECVVRGYLTGSGWASYQAAQQVCGIKLPPGLHDGSRIEPGPIFTPTTKAETGHDQHLPAAEVRTSFGPLLENQSLMIYQRMARFCLDKGLILADTKFEFGAGGILADEVGTPDSSRFWDGQEWINAGQQRKSPPPFDKEIVRIWGKLRKINERDPEKPDDQAYVWDLQVPDAVIDQTINRYEIVLQRLTGLNLVQFQQQKMGLVQF